MNIRQIIPCLLGLLVFGCASGSKDEGPTTTTRNDAPQTNVSIPQSAPGPEGDMLVNVVRKLGQDHGGGVALMHGIGYETVPPGLETGRTLNDTLKRLAGAMDLAVTESPGYAFVYPADYAVLNAWDDALPLPATFPQAPVGAAFGNGTKLSSALAFLSHATGATLLADNAVADARTGELWLPPLPLDQVLKAVLKSARVPAESVRVETADNLIFLRSRGNQSAPRLIGPTPPRWTEAVTVHLPALPEGASAFPLQFQPTRMGALAPALSAQLGLTIELAPGFEDLPVEQCSFMAQSREQVLRYLISQWPAQGIGYRWTGTALRIERY